MELNTPLYQSSWNEKKENGESAQAVQQEQISTRRLQIRRSD